MTKKEKIRVIRILILSALFSGGVAGASYLAPQVRQIRKPQLVRNIEEKIKESQAGKTVLKVLGEEVREDDGDNTDRQKEDKDERKINEAVQERIKDVIMKKSSEKIIEILRTLPVEEQERLKKDFCQ